MSNFATGILAVAHSPLVMFLGAIGGLVLVGKHIWPRILDYSDRYIDNMVDRALAEITFTDDELACGGLDEIDDVLAAEHQMRLEDHLRHLGLIDPDPFIDLRAEIAALETTEDFR